MNTAFYHYGLTDTIPEKYYLATERGAKISDNRVVLKFENSDILFLGAVQESVNGATVSMYNRERMLLELIRNKSNLPFDYYKEIILNYRKIVDELDMQFVQDYLPQMPKADMIRKVLEAEVL
jgi:predicted transcriptional regulator of viral defense system